MRDSKWSSECKTKSSMVITGLFSNGSFEMRPELWPSKNSICISTSISSLIFSGTGSTWNCETLYENVNSHSRHYVSKTVIRAFVWIRSRHNLKSTFKTLNGIASVYENVRMYMKTWTESHSRHYVKYIVIRDPIWNRSRHYIKSTFKTLNEIVSVYEIVRHGMKSWIVFQESTFAINSHSRPLNEIVGDTVEIDTQDTVWNLIA